MHSVARLHYATLIDNIQVSWVKMGIAGSTADTPGGGQ